jgi:hypothetical protein
VANIIPSKTFLYIISNQIITKPGGKREVTPVILPDPMPVNVDVEKLVDASTVMPNKLVEVNVQSVNVELDKFVPDKSKEAGNIWDVYVVPWPVTTIVIRSLLMISA